MLDNQFQFAILATEDRIRDMRSRNSASNGVIKRISGTKRIFRLDGHGQLARQVGRG